MCATASSRRAGARALLTELEHAAREAPDRRVETMFFGGGTPSLMEPETVGALIARTRELWDTARRCRDHAGSQPDLGRGGELRGAGRGRRQPRVAGRAGARSGGAELPRPRAFGRRGDRRDRDGAPALRALFVRPDLCPAGPDGRKPGSAELERALALAGEHLSLYQLTIERGTRFFADHARGAFDAAGRGRSRARCSS